MLLYSLTEIINEIATLTANRIEQLLKSAIKRLQSSNVKAIYNEQDAADFLGITKVQLQKYRNNKVINYIHYPSASGFPSDRNGLYAYYLVDLMNFAESHHRKGKCREEYSFTKIIDARGLELK